MGACATSTGVFHNYALIPVNQVIPIDSFSVTNIYFNYVLANGSHFRETKLRLSVNNLFDSHSIVGVTQAINTAAVYTPGPADQLNLMPGRSITGTITLGYSPRGR